eukprot:gene13074-9363_t
MSQHEYYEFVAEPDPTINALHPVTKETRSLAQTEFASCLREFLCYRLPNLLHIYEAEKAIDQTIDVNIPLAAIKNTSRCDHILNDLRAGLLNDVSAVQTLQNVVAQLQGLEDANENIDVAPYLFQEELTQADLQLLRKTPAAPQPAVDALSYGFFQSSYYNLMTDTVPSPAEMLIQRLRPVSTWGAECRDLFYANFACLVQGSGSGKSRTAKECSAHFYEVYLCLRPASSSGIPPRSALATPFLDIALATKESRRNLIDRFFAAIFHVIATEVDWVPYRTDRRVSPSAFWEYTMEQADSFSEKVQQVFWEWRANPTMPQETVAYLMDKAQETLDPHKSTTFLVVLDEARELLCTSNGGPEEPSLFLQWRSWLSESGTWSKSFFLLLDTTSRDWISALAGAPLSHSDLSEGGFAPGTSTVHVRLARVLASGVSFTGWTVAQEPIIGPMLQYAWCHRVGYLCNDEEPAMDLVLPLVQCPSETSHAEETHAVASATPRAGAVVGMKDAATAVPTVKRPFAASSTGATAGGSAAKVIAAAPTAPRMSSRRDANNYDDEGRRDCGTNGEATVRRLVHRRNSWWVGGKGYRRRSDSSTDVFAQRREQLRRRG